MREVFGKYLPGRAVVLAAGDALLALAVLSLGASLHWGASDRILAGALAAVLLSAAMVYLLFLLGRYGARGPAPVRGLAGAACLLGAVVAVFGLALPGLLPCEGLFLGLAVLPLFLWSWGLFTNMCRKRGFFSETAVMVGAGLLAEQVAAAATNQDIRLISRNGKPDPGFSLLHEHARSQDRFKLLRRLPIIGRLFPGVVVVAADEPGVTGGQRRALILSANGIPVLSGEAFYEKVTGSVLLEYLERDPAWKAGGRAKPSRGSTAWELAERAAALFLALLLSPVLLLTAAAIKLSSRGPVLIRQERVGKDGKPFTMLKFRSMKDEAEKDIGPVWAEKDDPRITRVGRFIRKTHIDELPQLFNVLLGHMSLVGPRPERPFFVEKLSRTIPGYHLRHTVRPGITGWAQINYSYGASQNDAREKLRYELFYIKHRTPALDLYILLATARTLFATSGAR